MNVENDKLLLAARKVRRATRTSFVISLVSDDFSHSSSTYVGKLKYASYYVDVCGMIVLLCRSYLLTSPLFLTNQAKLPRHKVHNL